MEKQTRLLAHQIKTAISTDLAKDQIESCVDFESCMNAIRITMVRKLLAFKGSDPIRYPDGWVQALKESLSRKSWMPKFLRKKIKVRYKELSVDLIAPELSKSLRLSGEKEIPFIVAGEREIWQKSLS